MINNNKNKTISRYKFSTKFDPGKKEKKRGKSKQKQEKIMQKIQEKKQSHVTEKLTLMM